MDFVQYNNKIAMDYDGQDIEATLIVVFLIVLCFGVEFLCCLGLMCVFIFLVQFG